MNRASATRRMQHLRELSQAFTLWIDDEDGFVIVSDLRLPPGYNASTTNLLIELPPDYPLSPPGVGSSHVYLDPSLRLLGRKLKDLHDECTPSFATPGFENWAWFCYEEISWSPMRDDLIKFVEMVRANLTNPQTQWSIFS